MDPLDTHQTLWFLGGVMTRACRQIELGRTGSVQEVMVKWEGSRIPIPYTYFRTSSMVAYAEICAPEDILNNSWNDIENCALAAADAATIASIIAGPAAALPAFQASFTPCVTAKIGARAGEIQIALSAQQKPNEEWHR